MDVESGRLPTMPTNANQVLDQQQQLMARTHQLVFALVFLFFVFGMLPTSFVMWFLLAVLVMMMWQRWTTPQQYDLGADVAFGDDLQHQLFLNHPLLVFASSGQVDLVNLRLSLMDREFSDQDYEMLLTLDQQTNASPLRPVSDEDISRLPLHKIKIISSDEDLPATSNRSSPKLALLDECVCPICLDSYKDKDQVLTMPCLHRFHQKCIIPWIKQQGKSKATCPVCKGWIFETQEQGSSAVEASENV
eukprot:TRINITY_DN474_c0_g1_i3.p1 TRINITY_DN474_c0_g1~~TRINITY_DN474_c0_g1_i3.p1  ORF type:complete len:248 (+),score=25.67 TRINITY_DN474_c0_g1_i3:282-1025(+)